MANRPEYYAAEAKARIAATNAEDAGKAAGMVSSKWAAAGTRAYNRTLRQEGF